MSAEWLSRQSALIGEAATERLCRTSVLVFGAGGVGGYVVEALARAGVGKITVVDHDRVAESNINRQIIADTATVGRLKAEVACERIKKINPCAEATAVTEFADASNIADIIRRTGPEYAYIADAIDTVTSKLAIIEAASALHIGVISCMGTGNKLDPSRFRIADIAQTSVCPLARVMRREVKARGIGSVEVLFSDEPVVKTGLRTPASISYVPACAGLMIAGHILRTLTEPYRIGE